MRQMSRLRWVLVIAWILAALFAVSGFLNVTAPPQIRAQYQQWGYPAWFHFVTGSLELTAAVFLVFGSTRRWASVLGATVLSGAIATLLVHREFIHALTPAFFLVLAALVAWARPNVPPISDPRPHNV